MRVPPGVPSQRNGRRLVCRLLQRSLYGLKQAGREWAQLFTEFLVSFGFIRSIIDTCLYTFSDGPEILWVVIWVDDAVIADNSPDLRARFVAAVSDRFPTEDKGELTWILNTKIIRGRSRRSLQMSQELYISDLLEKHAPLVAAGHGRTFDIPLAEGTILSPADRVRPGDSAYDELEPQRASYMTIVGGLLWLANLTRPDLAYNMLLRNWPVSLRCLGLFMFRPLIGSSRTFITLALVSSHFPQMCRWVSKFSSTQIGLCVIPAAVLCT